MRVYHRLTGSWVDPDDTDDPAGLSDLCWAFTLSRSAYIRLATDGVLDSDGATYPDGRLVVPIGVDPLYVPVGCGTCLTHAVECLQIAFFED